MQPLTQAHSEGSLGTISPTATRPSTIAFIEAGTADGGSISWLLSALKYLDRRRFEPLIIFYYAARGPTVEKIRALGVPMYFASTESPGYFPTWLRILPRPWLLRKCVSLCRIAYRILLRDVPITRAVRRHLRERRVAVVVLNSDLHFQYCGAVAARLEKLPILCRKSGGIEEGLRIKKLLTRFVDVFVPISKATEKDQLANPATKRSVLVYEGVDMSRYRGRRQNPTLRSTLGLPENKKIVTSIARLEVGKGQAELLEAAASVLQEFPEAMFLIVGEENLPNGSNTSDLHRSVLRLGLAKHVVFAGGRGDVPDLLAITDVFVHCPTTWIEGLGICQLEAMASGKPSVISRNGGLPETAIDGVTALVVPPGDIPAISAAILRFLRNPELASQFGQAARARAEELFDIAANNTVYEDLLQELANRQAKQGTNPSAGRPISAYIPEIGGPASCAPANSLCRGQGRRTMRGTEVHMPGATANVLNIPRPLKFDTAAEERLHRKRMLAAAFRLFSRFGFDEGVAGHITARDPERLDHFWVNPFGMHFGQIRASDLILVNHRGDVVEGKYPVNGAAFAIHSQVHAARPEVIAAAHAHSMYGKAWASLGRLLDPITQDSCAFYEDHGLFADFTSVVYETSEGARIAQALGKHKAVILRNHGLLTVGQTVEEAAWWFITMDRSCQAQLLAEAAGVPVKIDPATAVATREQIASPMAGWFQFQPMLASIMRDEPDLLE